ncbi:MAG TPA: DUF445 domain-containing protein [Stellaceae bacterium]|nr:DUF445 domain-containing protein [Stellaceae bacterium]
MVQLPVTDAAQQPRNIESRAALRRMRIVATGLLVLMLALFIIAWRFEARLAWLAYLRAFSEAGMVGACADWFAVVALFRRPLGLPIPHTAILPQNKGRIGDTIGSFFVRNFFNSQEVAARLDRIDVAAWLARWLRDPENLRLLVTWSRGMLPPAIELIGKTELRSASRDLIKNGIDSIAAAPLTGRILAVLIAQGQHVAAFDWGLEALIEFIGGNRQVLRRRTGEKTASWLPGWVDAKLADAFTDGVLEALAAARAPDHPWRDEYAAYLEKLVARLAEDPELYDRFESVKSGVLDTELVDDYLAWLASETETRLKIDWGGTDGALAKTLEHGLTALGHWLETNDNIREAINRSARELVMNTVVPHRDEIGTYVSDVVGRWDSETLVTRFELTVGRDLQFIRINGTLVGGAVGLALFSIARWLG